MVWVRDLANHLRMPGRQWTILLIVAGFRFFSAWDGRDQPGTAPMGITCRIAARRRRSVGGDRGDRPRAHVATRGPLPQRPQAELQPAATKLRGGRRGRTHVTSPGGGLLRF